MPHGSDGLVDREDERKGQAPKAPCLIPAATLKAIMKALAPLGAENSVITPLPERLLPGLIEGSLRPQSSFGYSVPGSYLVVAKPPRGLRKSRPTLVYG